MNKMKVAILIRTSTEEQNPENQLKDIESISGKVYVLYEEKGSAWKDKERPIIQRIKKDIKAGKITDFYVWDFDRIYRNRDKFKAFLLFLKTYKVKLHSFRQDWFETLHQLPEPFDEMMYEFMISLYGWMGEDESRKKSERVKIAVRKVKGITKSYKGNKWGRKSISPQKKNKILQMKKQGKSLRSISKELNVSIGVVHKYVHENIVGGTA